jgi:ketosteroid isomerase-like protein
MHAMENPELVESFYRAYERRDRDALEAALADDFTFSSPYDDRIGKAEFLERCFPNPDLVSFAFKRIVDGGDEVVVTYEYERKQGGRTRNTEVLALRDGRIASAEVYFGWVVSD